MDGMLLQESIVLTLVGSVDIDRGKQLYSDLCHGQEALCVENHLHLLYLVTPYDMVDNITPHWMTYLDEVLILHSVCCVPLHSTVE